ncbi:hypothetical protein ACT3SP_08210 [Brachybacterium sp. AOP43-C2-M15]|uniref:hypothetical protein n=1 Tax=Brachybacterium sp. AOP43-C2-M15 TaxID=3457661 RepID=UPI004033FB57
MSTTDQPSPDQPAAGRPVPEPVEHAEVTGPAEAAVTDGSAGSVADYSTEKRIGRTVAVTMGWWAHGAVRLLLALVLLYYGGTKLVLGQFGLSDPGDALIAHGEMSPMGLLWRMVAFSPLFQFLAGLAETGAGLALLWRRSVPFGAVLAAGSMALVLVLNLGYDVMVKTPTLIYLVMALIVLIPWMPRVFRAFFTRGQIPRGPLPTLIPWRPLARVTNVLGPIAAVAIAVLVAWSSAQLYEPRSTDDSVPAGVWTVQEDTAEPAAQLSEDDRWARIAFGDTLYGEASQVQLRLADGTLLSGTYQRTGEGAVELSLKPLREEGQSIHEFLEAETLDIALTVQEQGDGTLHVTGDGVDLVLAPDESASTLYERGFSWPVRSDDPFNR